MSVHASCISVDGKGVLFLGESGSGKSDLALRFIDSGAKLVADDRVHIHSENHQLIASAPEKLRGLIEARGIGILTLPYAPNAPLMLAVKLVLREQVERMPLPQFFSCLDLQLPLLSLHAFDDSTPAKIRLWLQQRG